MCIRDSNATCQRHESITPGFQTGIAKLGNEAFHYPVFFHQVFAGLGPKIGRDGRDAVSYTHLRAHETVLDLVCRLLLEKKKKPKKRIDEIFHHLYKSNTNQE